MVKLISQFIAWIIGVPAYPLTPYCMKEYQTCAENKQVAFNNLLRSARIQIEHVFPRLKSRWRVLTKTVDLKFEVVLAVVYSCFVLYNFCESQSYSGLDEEELEAQIMRHRLEEQNNIYLPKAISSDNTREGEYIRIILTNLIQEHLSDGY